jgi:putative MFS transporter
MILAQLPGYVAAAWLVEKLGRKATLAGFIGCVRFCVFLWSSYLSQYDYVVGLFNVVL